MAKNNKQETETKENTQPKDIEKIIEKTEQTVNPTRTQKKEDNLNYSNIESLKKQLELTRKQNEEFQQQIKEMYVDNLITESGIDKSLSKLIKGHEKPEEAIKIIKNFIDNDKKDNASQHKPLSTSNTYKNKIDFLI